MFLCRECVRKTLLTPIRHQQLHIPQVGRNAVTVLRCRLSTRVTIRNSSDPSSSLRSRTQPTPRREAAIAKAVSYLKDSYSVAQYVQSILRQDRYSEAMEVVKKATSKSMDVVVSWNHLLEYDMAKERPRLALKAFNDMKKRGQLPNAQTYTAIFAGCARLKNPRPFLPEALRLYNLMHDNKRLPPNIVHVNNLLHACARAHDLESLYLILGDVTEAGPLAPDARTFTITFNALRSIYHRESTDIDTVQMEKDRSATIYRSGKIWADARRRWRAGKLALDEEAVCAYGRLLLEEGSREASEEIFTLLNETMNIPKPQDVVVSQSDMLSLTPTANSGSGYVKPGPNSLSLLLIACQHPQRTGKAPAYWRVLTEAPYRVIPDAENWHQYLRTLRKSHNSAKALEAVLATPPQFVAPKTFRISMSACVRDNLNAQSFEHAGKMLDVMSQTLPTPDPRSLRMYLRVATVAGRRAYMEKGEPGTEAYARQLTRSLERMWDPMKLAWEHAFGGAPLWDLTDVASESLRESLQQSRNAELKQKITERQSGWRVLDLKALDREDKLFDEEEEAWLGEGKAARLTAQQEREASAIAKHLVRYNEQREVVAVARRMLTMYDRVLDIGGGGMEGPDLDQFKMRRNQLNGRVSKFFAERELREPNLPSAIRKAQLEKERIRIEQARMRYQKPMRHRYTTV